MNKAKVIIACAWLLLGLLSLSLTAAALTKESWTQENSPTGYTLNDVCAVNANLAWAVGECGTILRRTDYGSFQVWESLNNLTQYDFHGVDVLTSDTRHVWVVGVDRGTGAGVLFKTVNGNDPTPTWVIRPDIHQSIPTTFKSVKFHDSYKGYITGANGLILLTTDGCISWTKIPSPPTQLLKDTVTIWHNSFWLDPTNSDRLWSSGDAFGLLSFTQDAGYNWTTSSPYNKEYKFPLETNLLYPTGYQIFGMDAVNSSEAYVGLGFGRVGWTHDGGANWYTQGDAGKFQDTTVWIRDVSVGGQHLYAVGDNGVIIKYPNRDMNAGIMEHKAWNKMNAISMIDAGNGFAVGNQGQIYKRKVYDNLQTLSAPEITFYPEDEFEIKVYKPANIVEIPNCVVEVYICQNSASNTDGPWFSFPQALTFHAANPFEILSDYTTRKGGDLTLYYRYKVAYASGPNEGFTDYSPWSCNVDNNSNAHMSFDLEPPTLINATPGPDCIIVNVTTPAPTNAEYYCVYRSSSLDPQPKYINWTGAGASQIYDYDVFKGITYYYYVRSRVGAMWPFSPTYDQPLLGWQSPPSNTVSCVITDNTAPPQITNLNGYYDGATKTITLTWPASSAWQDIGAYWICPEPVGKFACELPPSGELLKHTVEHSSPIDRLIYKYGVADDQIGNTFGFAVAAMDRSGNIGPWSPTEPVGTKIAVNSSSPFATAYNNGKKLIFDKYGNLHLSYVSGDSVYYLRSYDDGYSWTPSAGLPSGGTDPSVSMSVSGTDAYLVWKTHTPLQGWTVNMAKRSFDHVWSDQRTIIEQASWYDQYHLVSPPSVYVDETGIHVAIERYDCFLVPGGQSGHWTWSVSHGKYDLEQDAFIWTTLDDTSGSWTNLPPTDPKSPSICKDSKGGIHVVWDRDGDVFWRMYDPYAGSWKTKVNLSQSPDVVSCEPSLAFYGDVHMVWQEGNDVYHRKGNWGAVSIEKGIVPLDKFNWSTPENVSNNASTASLWPVYDGGYVVWSEEVSPGITEAFGAHYTDYEWQMLPGVSKNPTQPSNYPHIAYRQNTDGNRMVSVWTEGKGPLYSIIARDTAGQVTPTYSALLGGEEPGIYTIERDGYLTFDNGISVDYDSTELQYYLPSLDANQETSVELVFYQPGAKADIQQKVYINDIPLGVANIPAGEVFTFSRKIPPAAMKDGDGILRIENKKGVYASCAKWQLLAYDRATGRGGGKSGGQAELGGEKPIAYRYELLQNAPNPCRQGTTIRYQLAKPGNVSLKVYNTLGQVVKTIVDSDQQPGLYSINWDGKDNQGRQVANGVYLYRLSAGSFTDTKKLVKIK